MMKEWLHFRENKYLFAALYMVIAVLYLAVSYQSYGYDDEFFNINLIEKLGLKTIPHLQHTDVHPPLSYIINVALYRLFNSWRVVRLASALLISASLIAVINNQRRLYGGGYALVVVLLLALNPALLMWCTGIRWYAYFLPLMLYLIFQPVHNGYKAWAIAFATLTLLGYTGYIVFLIGIPVLLLYWALSTDDIKDRLKYILYLSPVFLLVYAYQLYIFMAYHIKGRHKEVKYSLPDNIRGYFISQISNQGIFPVSVPALLSVAGSIGILFCIIKYSLSKAGNKRSNLILAAYLLAAVLLIVSGVAGKPRNLIVLIPLQVYLIVHFYGALKNNIIYTASIALIAIANICGCVHVFCHENTTKNSWNLPIKETMARIEAVKVHDSSVVVFTHDPTLAYVLQHNGYKVVSLYNSNRLAQYDSVKTAIFINTFRGSLSRPLFNLLMLEEDSIKSTGKEVLKIGQDKYYRWKRKMAEEYPEYQVELMIYHNPVNINDLTAWNKKRG